MSKYYVAMVEWNYPTESGRDFIGDFDSFKVAMERCELFVNNEKGNFAENCKVDGLPPTQYKNAFVITPKNELDDWFYAARVIEVEKFK